MAGFEEIREYQAIHEAAGIRLRVVLREGASAEKVALQLEEKLKGTLESVRARCPEVRIEFLDKIERDPRQMGQRQEHAGELDRLSVRAAPSRRGGYDVES